MPPELDAFDVGRCRSNQNSWAPQAMSRHFVKILPVAWIAASLQNISWADAPADCSELTQFGPAKASFVCFTPQSPTTDDLLQAFFKFTTGGVLTWEAYEFAGVRRNGNVIRFFLAADNRAGGEFGTIEEMFPVGRFEEGDYVLELYSIPTDLLDDILALDSPREALDPEAELTFSVTQGTGRILEPQAVPALSSLPSGLLALTMMAIGLFIIRSAG